MIFLIFKVSIRDNSSAGNETVFETERALGEVVAKGFVTWLKA